MSYYVEIGQTAYICIYDFLSQWKSADNPNCIYNTFIIKLDRYCSLVYSDFSFL